MAGVFSKNTRKSNKKRRRSVFSMILAGMLAAFLLTSATMQYKIMNIRREREAYELETALQEKEYERLSEKAKYSKSDDFYEQKARDEGYVSENETVFVVGN